MDAQSLPPARTAGCGLPPRLIGQRCAQRTSYRDVVTANYGSKEALLTKGRGESWGSGARARARRAERGRCRGWPRDQTRPGRASARGARLRVCNAHARAAARVSPLSHASFPAGPCGQTEPPKRPAEAPGALSGSTAEAHSWPRRVRGRGPGTEAGRPRAWAQGFPARALESERGAEESWLRGGGLL